MRNSLLVFLHFFGFRFMHGLRKIKRLRFKRHHVSLPTCSNTPIVCFSTAIRRILRCRNSEQQSNVISLPKFFGKYHLTVDNIPQKGTVVSDFVRVETGSGKHIVTIKNVL
jgi:hypothetical protein